MSADNSGGVISKALKMASSIFEIVLSKAWATHKNIIKKHFLNNIKGVSWKMIQDKRTMKSKLEHRNKKIAKPKKRVKAQPTAIQGELAL